MSKFFNQEIKNKDDAFDYVKNNVKNFNTVLNRAKNIKKNVMMRPDSICVGICHFISKSQEV